MVTLIPNGNQVNINVDGTPVGSVHLYDNPCHKQNRYVRLELTRPDPSFSAELCEQLHRMENRPLQATVESDDSRTVEFLTAGGFVCKRKCYEVEASGADRLVTAPPAMLLRARRDTPEYETCCRLLYDHYVETHRPVNPWTAGYLFFLDALPDEALYETVDGETAALAFVEGNEIAYVYCAELSLFPGFAAALTEEIFSCHETVCFESDDCDPIAMELRSMFANQSENSFDTYIFDR